MGAADETFQAAGRLYERYATNVFASTDSENGLSIVRTMPKFMGYGAAGGLEEGGASVWIQKATDQVAATDMNGWSGFVFEAKLFGRLADEGRLTGIQGTLTKVRLNNNELVTVENDLVVTGPNGLRWMESKAGNVGTGSSLNTELGQLEKQMAAVQDPRLTVDRTEVEWTIGGTVGQPFIDGAQTLATEYNVALRILDADGNLVRLVNP